MNSNAQRHHTIIPKLLALELRQLQEFIGDGIPQYAILSHTWGEDEVLFQDLSDKKHKDKLGYAKIEGCCQQAIRDDFEFVWVDTCCIDKRSSAELSEAINSMFRWYKEAQVCYVYLVDVPSREDPCERNSAFSKGRWFTRGWTLQELIAPPRLEFFDTTWTEIIYFDRRQEQSLKYGSWAALLIGGITGIETWAKYAEYRPDMPVATKLSWVSGRQTTRIEDMAYCLLGLLDVNMPLLYGEDERAFLRLQEEFLKKHSDPTILLWGYRMGGSDIMKMTAGLRPSVLAPTPALFQGFRGLHLERGMTYPWTETSRFVWTVTPYGLHVELPLLRVDARRDCYICMTDSYIKAEIGNEYLAIPLRCRDSDIYPWIPGCGPLSLRIPARWFKLNKPKLKRFYISIETDYYGCLSCYERRLNRFSFNFFTPQLSIGLERMVFVNIDLFFEIGFSFCSIYPPARLDSANICLSDETVITLVRGRQDTLYLLVPGRYNGAQTADLFYTIWPEAYSNRYL
ncbi:HET-domain-containing protein [Xylaria digitata]|nr:HET-domain-containing protein [Xylaria digitata]